MMTRTKIFCFFLHFVALLYCVNTEKCCWTCLNLQMHLMAWDFPLKRRKKRRERMVIVLWLTPAVILKWFLHKCLLIWIIKVTNGPFLPLSCTYKGVPIICPYPFINGFWCRWGHWTVYSAPVPFLHFAFHSFLPSHWFWRLDLPADSDIWYELQNKIRVSWP